MDDFIAQAGNCLASRKLLEEDGQILWAWREKPLIPSDSGWRFLSDKEESTLLNPNETMVMVNLNEIIAVEPLVKGIYWYPIGSDFQFSNRKTDKHFVYNDTHERVTMATKLSDLPLNESTFKNHYPDYQKPRVKGEEKKVLVAHVREPKKAPTIANSKTVSEDSKTKKNEVTHTYIPSIDDTANNLSVAELKLLADAKNELKAILAIWKKILKSRPTNNEQYVMTGLLLGYLGIRNKEVPLEWATRRNLIVNTFYNQYQVPQEQTKSFIEAYERRRDNPEHIAEIQIIRYGRAMYEWYWQGESKLIQSQFAELIQHYI